MDYVVTGNLKHNGRVYAPGETIAFSAKDEAAAKQLLAAGVIEGSNTQAEEEQQTNNEAPKKGKKSMKALSPDTKPENDPSAYL
jgi:hypothetical protein